MIWPEEFFRWQDSSNDHLGYFRGRTAALNDSTQDKVIRRIIPDKSVTISKHLTRCLLLSRVY